MTCTRRSIRWRAPIGGSSSPVCPAWARAFSSASSRRWRTRWIAPCIRSNGMSRGPRSRRLRFLPGIPIATALHMRWSAKASDNGCGRRCSAGIESTPRSQSLLIGEVPLIGHRLVELVQVHADDAEPLLTDASTLFVTPVPSVAVRAAIERARQRTFANPTNPRESQDAAINIVQESWAEIRALAVEIGVAPPVSQSGAPFDPHLYAAVYRHLLRRRNALTVHVDVELAQTASVYDHAVDVIDIVPTPRRGRGDRGAPRARAHADRNRSARLRAGRSRSDGRTG